MSAARRVHASTRRARRGFTLLETGVVLAITALAALLVLPIWLGAERSAISADEEPFTSLLDGARRQAHLARQRVTVTVDMALQLVQVDTSGTNGDGTWQRFSLDRETLTQVDATVARATFTFRANGSAHGDSLRVRTADGWHWLTVDPWSGEVRHALR
jgi:prepilin-type N-terminal cleavage/methylation domain-containing protein